MDTPVAAAGNRANEPAPGPRGISWSAIFAGLAVGLGAHMLLMLVGTAAGLAVFGSGMRPVGSSLLIMAALWNTLSMLISAFVGGYVSVCSAGLRRRSDGLLYGVVTWAATALFVVVLSGSLGGHALSGTFHDSGRGSAAAPAASSALGQLVASLQRGDRATATGVLRERFGLSEEQAAQAVDQTLALRESPDSLDEAAQAASVAAMWLGMAMLLSLIAGAAGGRVGVRGLRQQTSPDTFAEPRFAEPRLSPTIGQTSPPLRASDPPGGN